MVVIEHYDLTQLSSKGSLAMDRQLEDEETVKLSPQARTLRQAIDLLERVYGYTRYDQPVHWSVCIDLRFFLERYSRNYKPLSNGEVGRW